MEIIVSDEDPMHALDQGRLESMYIVSFSLYIEKKIPWDRYLYLIYIFGTKLKNGIASVYT